ncbi:hypothetical protein SBRCBS47491_003258 [Sporothrix bragantina]|uniref:Uncharacterized protein n=1 Tax=Sporothrix bragantina TaxID=671064 RepID=A0ABP0BDU3_9PEZI
MAEATPTAEVCQFVGEPMPDIAGIGILIGFSGQAFLSLCLALWVFFFSRHGRLDMLHEDGSDEHEIETKRLEMVQDILMIGNDIQMMTGVALMVSVFTSYKKMDIYHFHLIYDIVCFVGVSVAAAFVCFTFIVARRESYRVRRHRRATGLADYDVDQDGNPVKAKRRSLFLSPIDTLRSWGASIWKTLPLLIRLDRTNPVIGKFAQSRRYRATYVFAAFFLALTIGLNAKLGQWNLEEPGRCYNTAYTSVPTASHPQADRVYVWVTFGWLMSVLIFSVYDGAGHRRYILIAGLLQFPVHFYMMIALRTANQGLLGITAEEAAEKAAATASSVASHAARLLLFARQESSGNGNSTDPAAVAAAEGEEENSENDWDFGQTTAVLLLIVAFTEAISKGLEFWRFERELKKKRAAKHSKHERQHGHGHNYGHGQDQSQDNGRDENGGLLAFHAVTSATSEGSSTSKSAIARLHPWKHNMPSRQQPHTEGGNESIPVVIPGPPPSAATHGAPHVGYHEAYDVEAANPQDRH